ncbi:uncharacterized protein GGS22DRAFT_129006, partial [Annulohypoxylon maeteangense]|uniref:uncharacterized protein n=1 Tax=Annulohypoxylon maeteangense TaxID=1927788 RepID=UPI0020076246
ASPSPEPEPKLESGSLLPPQPTNPPHLSHTTIVVAAPPPDAAPPPIEHNDDIAAHVEQALLGLFRGLPRDQAIFGEPGRDLVRLPFEAKRKNGQSWARVCAVLGASVEAKMGRRVPRGSCWMSSKTVIDITVPKGPHSNDNYKKITTVRLLAFLADPTDANWAKLNAQTDAPPGQRPIDSPFSHACSNGSQRAGVGGCINGVEHGRFATRGENESHKNCANGALALCPGHGTPPVKCVFVHKDGHPKPCKMAKDCVPKCFCVRRCY